MRRRYLTKQAFTSTVAVFTVELTWRGAEAFLGARIGEIDAPGVGIKGDASQRAHCVHNQKGAVLLAQLTQPFQALISACTALSLHHSHTTM